MSESKLVTLLQEVVAEDETELDENSSDSDEKNDTLGIERKISRESQQNGNLSRGDSRRISDYNIDSKLPSRKPSAANSASSSNCPSRRWSRHSSPTRGEILRMDDEMHTVNRGETRALCNFTKNLQVSSFLKVFKD